MTSSIDASFQELIRKVQESQYLIDDLKMQVERLKLKLESQNKLQEELKSQKEELESKKKLQEELESQKKELESKKKELESKKIELESKKKLQEELESQKEELESKKKLQEELEYYFLLSQNQLDILKKNEALQAQAIAMLTRLTKLN